jgi:hypothetical protein
MEVSDALVPPDELTARIARDLTTIRRAFPEIAWISHTPSVWPGSISIGLTPEARERWDHGDYHELDELNERFEATIVSVKSYADMLWIDLNVPTRYNVVTLAGIYAEALGVMWADPSIISVGGARTDIEVSGDEYSFKLGQGDCVSGCITRESWTFRVVDGVAELLGSTLPPPSWTAWVNQLDRPLQVTLYGQGELVVRQ